MNSHRHHRQSVKPPPIPIPSVPPSSRFAHPSHLSTPSSPFPFSPSSVSTPSKRRPSSLSSPSSSFPSLLLLLFSLRSLYSLLFFLRSTTSSFSLFPFSFLVSLLSFLISLPSSPFPLLRSHPRPLAAKSSLLALVLLLRFQALRYCGTSATILAEFSGTLVAQSLSLDPHPTSARRRNARRLRGFASLLFALLFLSRSWDRIGCFPLSSSPPPSSGCGRVAPMLLPFLSGFLSFYERASSGWGHLRQFGRKRVRSASLGIATLILFVPALVSLFFVHGDRSAGVSVWSLGWPLANTAIFGVLLADGYGDDKVVASTAKDLRREFLVTFFCTLVLELFYFPKLSLPGFLFCGFLMWFSVHELVSSSLSFVELGSSDISESLYSMIVNPLRHIMSERKSRKIALFLLINTGYMVVEFVAGFMSNSLGLISDACHMLFDCAALAIGLYASYISRLPANHEFNYGRGRFEVLSGYINAVLLVLVGALIVLESFERILDPQEISTNSLLTVSIGGLLVNMVGLVFFHEEHHHAHSGGGGTCAHSHSHHRHHHHFHQHHDHDHHHHQKSQEDHETHNILPHSQEHSFEHRQCAIASHQFSNGHSHDGHANHCSNHDDHDPRLGHHDHSLHAIAHVHQNHSEHRHEIHEPDISSNSHVSEDCSNNDSHSEEASRCKPSCLINPDIVPSSLPKDVAKGKPTSTSQQHRRIDHNMEGIFLHVLADTMGSLGVVASTLLIKYKGWLVADPACSIFISIMIISSVVPLLKNSAETLLQRIPRAHERDIRASLHDLMKVKGVCGVQNLHVWNFTNTDLVSTLHLLVLVDSDKIYVKQRAMEILREAGIKDITIQLECVNS